MTAHLWKVLSGLQLRGFARQGPEWPRPQGQANQCWRLNNLTPGCSLGEPSFLTLGGIEMSIRIALLAVTTAASTILWAPSGYAEQAPTRSSGADTAQVAPLVQPSIVYLAIEWRGYVWDVTNRDYIGLPDDPMEFTATTSCTGFVVNADGYIGTAGHCVDPRDGKLQVQKVAAQWAIQNGWYTSDTAYSDLVDPVKDVPIQSYSTNTLDANEQLDRNSVHRDVTVAWGAAVSGVEITESAKAEVLALQHYERGDAALLKTGKTDLNALPLAEADVEINDVVQTVGYPAVITSFTDRDLTPSFNPGTVSSEKTVADGLLDVVQLSADLSGGMSGGPTVNLDGEVIGVNSTQFVGESFNYAVPVERLRNLMAGEGVANTLSPTTQTYRRGILAFFAGDKAPAVTNLREVVESQPANGIAKEYLDKARALPDPPAPADDSSAMPWLVAGGIALLMVVGALAWLLLRRKGTRSAATAVSTPLSGAMVASPATTGPSESSPVPTVPSGDSVPEASTPSTVPDLSKPASPAAEPIGFTVSGDVRRSQLDEPISGTPSEQAPTSTVLSDSGPVPQQATGRFCTNCGTGASPAARFCASCGHPIE
jgi:serine protease Do